MRLVWHIFKKDLRQDRWALGFWVALFAVHFAVGMAFLDSDGTDLERIDMLRWASWLLTGFEYIIGYFLALRWGQADAVTGTRMFWVTRPISGGRLFAAKALGLLLVFALLPVALWLPWWITCGQGLRAIAWLALEMVGWQLAVIAPALLIGSLTDDFGRGIMWSLILVLAALAWSVLGQSGLAASGPPQTIAGVWFSRMVVAAGILVSGFIAVAAMQYLTRNTWQALVRISVMALLVVLVGRIWVVDFSPQVGARAHPFPAIPIPPPEAADGLRFSPTQARFSPFSYKQRGPTGGAIDVHSMTVSVDVAGLPDDLGLRGDYQHQELRWEDQPAIRDAQSRRTGFFPIESYFRRALSLPTVTGDPETIRWGRARLAKTNADRAAKGLPALDDWWDRPAVEPAVLKASFTVHESDLARLQSHPPAYLAKLSACLIRPVIMQQLPLLPESRGSGVARYLRIASVDDHMVKVIETKPVFMSKGLFLSRRGPNLLATARDLMRTEVWAVNHLTGDIDSVSRRRLVEPAISLGGIAFTWSEVNVHPARWIRDGQWVTKDSAWAANTSFVVITYFEGGFFTREIRGEKLAVRFPTVAPVSGIGPDHAAEAGEY